MRLKLYRGAGMAQAMSQLRSDLGDDALILATRRVSDGVEITAALESDEPPSSPLPLPDPARQALIDFHVVPSSLHDALLHGELSTALARILAFAPLPLGAGAPPVMLVGPPGAGKTLTVARLATRLVMSGTAPMVITADGQRAGATEQLAAFTRLLGINLTVACHPVTLGRALTRRQNDAPVLIDTPGCDPFDPAERDDLIGLVATAGAAVALVLPAGLDPAESADLAAAFAAIGATHIVATRLDLARRLGGVLAAATVANLALAEAGVGPGATDSLVPLTAEWLASRLLVIPPSECRQ